MIKRFGSLYAGHVEFAEGQCGFDTPAVNGRFLSDAELATPLATSVELAHMLEDLGFDTLWFAEHHFQREGYECLSNLLMLGVHIVQETQRIRIGCAFNVPPMWHPLRLAEDYAMADHLTDGRIRFGVGRGYHSREVEVFGAPILDQAANRDLFEEQLEIIFKAFNNRSFSHHGKYYDVPPKVPYRGYELDEITLVPRPKNLPVECWQPIVSASARGLDFMAKHGIKGIMGGGAGPGGANPEVVKAFQEAQARAGRETELGENLIVGLDIHLGETREKAIAEVRPYFEENTKMFAPLGFVPGLTREQIVGFENPTEELFQAFPAIDDLVDEGFYQFGSPQELIDELCALQEAYPGLEEVNVQSLVSAPKAMMMEQFQWFAEEVIPAVRATH